ncbi:class I SAM-dependent methyltransferase [Hufsiella ginkgonis]|uniref:THUMP-like domain-containing protein n=1 Tax=Hufsiella ginkgonis TaxID=2695274 RepID=A0A7K1XZ99_9SPHI|nr:class I SAM-dependent methyltransferase [Hufsiella ginkgonis]MXV15876.1 hypothetical protein [Hufsiella ginkgonis]
MNPAITDTAVQQFIRSHTDKDVTRILLSKSPFPAVSSRELAGQVESRRRCEKKLPLWFSTEGVYYPPKISIEQASSALTAKYKSSLLTGGSVIDLTGGFGVDSYYFSLTAEQVIHCELNPELSAISAHNAALLGAGNIRYKAENGISRIASAEAEFDTIYADPSRRTSAGKVFFLKDCEPDIVSTLPLLLRRAPRILVKTAPLLDIQSGLRELSHVSQIHVLSVKNECKEVLWLIERDFEGEPLITCSALADTETRSFSFKASVEREHTTGEWFPPGKYLYEPDAALMKGGAFKLIGERFGIQKLHQHSHLYTAGSAREDFIGRTFTINEVSSYKDFSKGSQLKKANIISRNFPLTVGQIRTKHKIAEGGEQYLFFTTVHPDKLVVIDAAPVRGGNRK